MRSRVICLLLAVAITLSLVITGCGKLAEKASEKAAEKAIEDASGGKADVELSKDKLEVKTDGGSVKVGDSNEWPKQMPADVPKFTYGKITSVAESTTAQGNNIIVGIENAGAESFDEYKSDLESAGWKIDMTSRTEDGFTINASKEKRQVVAVFNSSGGEGLSGGVTYVELKQ